MAWVRGGEAGSNIPIVAVPSLKDPRIPPTVTNLKEKKPKHCKEEE